MILELPHLGRTLALEQQQQQTKKHGNKMQPIFAYNKSCDNTYCFDCNTIC